MSLVTFRHRKHVKPSDVPGRTGSERITFLAPPVPRTIAGPLQRAVRGVYPVLLVFTIFAAVLVATIALRLLIWLPISAR